MHLLGICLLQSPYGLVHLEVIVGRERLDGRIERLVEEDVIRDLSKEVVRGGTGRQRGSCGTYAWGESIC